MRLCRSASRVCEMTAARTAGSAGRCSTGFSSGLPAAAKPPELDA